jgi:hypothetical protein
MYIVSHQRPYTRLGIPKKPWFLTPIPFFGPQFSFFILKITSYRETKVIFGITASNCVEWCVARYIF